MFLLKLQLLHSRKFRPCFVVQNVHFLQSAQFVMCTQTPLPVGSPNMCPLAASKRGGVSLGKPLLDIMYIVGFVSTNHVRQYSQVPTMTFPCPMDPAVLAKAETHFHHCWKQGSSHDHRPLKPVKHTHTHNTHTQTSHHPERTESKHLGKFLFFGPTATWYCLKHKDP